MTFGIETYEGLTDQDFVFPKMNQPVLSGTRAPLPKIYIGLPKWGRKEWIGRLYPTNIKEKEFLDYYAKHFNSIEMNATHYKIESNEGIRKWADKVSDYDFKFCPKMYQGITHRGSLNGKEFISDQFFESINSFGRNLGSILIQVSETFAPKRKNELFGYLKSLPTTYSYFLEVRHPDWFSSKEIFDELTNNLLELKIGFIITDTPNRRDVVHMKLTIPQAFVRFSCFGDQELDKVRIALWKNQLKEWYSNGLETCYFFLHIKDGVQIDFAKHVQTEFQNVVI